MFMYLLIAAELAVLYTVFWYLYLREPKCNHRIKGNLWGRYESAISSGCADPMLPFATGHDSNGSGHIPGFARAEGDWKKQFAAAYQSSDELVLDQITNHYVIRRNALQSRSLILRMAVMLDNTLSLLNVRP